MRPPGSVLAGVVEEITEHLGQTNGIGVEINRLVGQHHFNRLLIALGKRPAGFDGVPDDGREIHACLAKLQLVAGDAADIEQVVDQADHVRQLAPQDVGGVAKEPRVALGSEKNLERVADGW